MRDMAEIRNADISEYQPDPHNLNKGTERGEYMVRQSLAKLGAGRSIVVDAQGRTIAGAHVLQAAADLNLPVIEVTTNGQELVVVKRTDLDYDETDRARELSIADNRTTQVNLDFDSAALLDISKAIPLDDWFFQGEIDAMKDAVPVPDQDSLSDKYGEHDEEDLWPVIKVRVSPEVNSLYQKLLALVEGEEEADKFEAVLLAAEKQLI